MDGSCCMVRQGKLYKRREIKRLEVLPPNFEPVDFDQETQKAVGWVPVSVDSPEDRWHREAMYRDIPDGTYELIGPKVQGNPEKANAHYLMPHYAMEVYSDVPRDFFGIRRWLETHPTIEGLVFHHSDGRMAKIKLRDFGIRRQ